MNYTKFNFSNSCVSHIIDNSRTCCLQLKQPNITLLDHINNGT